MNHSRVIQVSNNTAHVCQPNSGSLPFTDLDHMLIWMDDKNKQLKEEIKQLNALIDDPILCCCHCNTCTGKYKT